MNNPFKKRIDEETQKKLKRKITANEITNVKNINSNILYTRDNHLFVYIKIQPLPLELLPPREQRIKGRKFSSEFSIIKCKYKFLSVSRPVDVSFMLDNLQKLQSETQDIKRKEVLIHKTREVNQFALSGDILEHQFYMVLWFPSKKDIEREINKQVNEIISHFKACEMDVSICKEGDIVKFLNLNANPNYAHLENEDYTEYIPFIN